MAVVGHEERALPHPFTQVGEASKVSGALKAAENDAIISRDTEGDDTYAFNGRQGSAPGTVLPASEETGRTKGSNLRCGVIVTGRTFRGNQIMSETDHSGVLEESKGQVVIMKQKGAKFSVSDEMQRWAAQEAAANGRRVPPPEVPVPADTEQQQEVLQELASAPEPVPTEIEPSSIDVVLSGDFGAFSLTYHWATQAPPCYIVLGFRKGTAMFTPAANKPVCMTIGDRSQSVVFTGIQFAVPSGLVLHIFKRVEEASGTAATPSTKGDEPIL